MGVMLSRNNNPDYNKLINKPPILEDDQISWEEIQGKPNTLPPTEPTEFTQIVRIRNSAPGIRFSESDKEIDQKEFYLVVNSGRFIIQARNDDFSQVQSTLFYVDRTDKVFTVEKLRCTNLPTSSVGLLSGQLYKDTNGFVKIV